MEAKNKIEYLVPMQKLNFKLAQGVCEGLKIKIILDNFK